jgi:hypothetical protein
MVVVGADAWKVMVILGDRPADDVLYLSHGRSANHWLEWEFGGCPVD